MREPGPRRVARWSRANTIWLGGLLALLPVQFVLLRFGSPSGTTDVVGVLITIMQWMLLTAALRPRSVR